MVNNINGEKTSGVMTIRQIVLDYKERWEDYSNARIMHFEKMAIKIITDLSIFTMKTTEVIYLTVGSNSTIDLPNDFINYTKIGVVDAFGTLWTLTLNENGFRIPGDECGADIGTALRGNVQIPDSRYYWAPHFYGTAYNDAMYSVGGGFNTGYYTIDRQGMKLVITGLAEGTSVVMEYRSTGIKLNGKTRVPREAFEAIVAWIDWQEAKRGKNGMDPGAAKTDFLEEERKLKTFQSKLTMNEWQDAIASTYSQSVRRGTHG